MLRAAPGDRPIDLVADAALAVAVTSVSRRRYHSEPSLARVEVRT